MDDDKTKHEDLDSTETVQPQSPVLPERVGPYRLVQKLGEGGMGVVYEAEQEKPVRRRVALKVIKHGMDTKAVVARFVVHYKNGGVEDIPVISESDVVDWLHPEDSVNQGALARVFMDDGQPAAMCVKTWKNPHPDKTISHVDFVSGLVQAAPFLVAITLE